MNNLLRRSALTALCFGVPLAAAMAQDADNKIRIGVVAAESGAFVSAGHTLPAGVSLAVDEINKAGGVKVGDKTYTIELLKRDDRTDISTAIAAT